MPRLVYIVGAAVVHLAEYSIMGYTQRWDSPATPSPPLKNAKELSWDYRFGDRPHPLYFRKRKNNSHYHIILPLAMVESLLAGDG